MKILVLNESPHPNGNTAALVDAFVEKVKENGHGGLIKKTGGKRGNQA